jgi:predicted TIM-barrel fold metal-dependent hydrolase
MPDDNETLPLRTVDVHFHVGLRGDVHPEWGHISEKMRKNWPDYDIFLLFGGIKKGEDTDDRIIKLTLEVINSSTVDHVVCLALDHVYDEDGTARKDKSDFWVANEFLHHLREKAGEFYDETAKEKVLYGASVHPYDPRFEARVEECVEAGAVLMKWLPSGQQFTLANPKVRSALKFLATAKEGKPLPLLLHTGAEYAVPTSDERTRSWDYLSWGAGDRIANFWRFGKKWHVPNIHEVSKTIHEGLKAGCQIIFAHCGLPYFAPKAFRFLEHDDFPAVREFLIDCAIGKTGPGKCYADLSACVTPFRKGYFNEIQQLPKALLLFGSDYPTPFFEIYPDKKEVWNDFNAMRQGEIQRIAVPQGNPIDVNYRELKHAFPEHSMFTNFDRYLW